MKMELYHQYTRQHAHDIFAPEAPFTPQAGTWGLQGIIPLPDRPLDFVLFVTFGQSQSGFDFDEGITSEGVLRWQSQPKQTLNDKQVRQFIDHDETQGSIFLFLRTETRARGTPKPYTYMGRLKYLAHDSQRQQPVHFDWQLLDWPVPQAVLDLIGLKIEQVATFETAEPIRTQGLRSAHAPRQNLDGRGISTRAFKSRVKPDYALKEMRDRELGRLGEMAVFQFEREFLAARGLHDLAEKVRHISADEGDGAGYDILSFFADGRTKYIEVKTTKGPLTSDYFIAANEVAFSAQHAENFELVRVYDFDSTTLSGQFYSIIGDISAAVHLTPVQFKIGSLFRED